MIRLRKERGFSLVELLIVVIVSSIIFPMMMTIVGGMAKQTTKSRQITLATDLGRELMERIRAMRFDENQRLVPTTPSADWTPVCPNTPCLGPDTGETSSTYDDVDDWNTYSDTPVPGYTRSVEVVYGSPPWLTASSTPTNYKRITVNVIHSAIGTMILVTLVGGWGN